ncbi:MAG: O-antigen ligase family protein [Bryobacterales bacterium]|nr:O-antigen ligase family protein [Bryobacterales bacterium]
MTYFILTCLSAALAYAVFNAGGTLHESWNTCLVLIGLTGTIYFLNPKYRRVPLDRITSILLVLVVLLSAAQVVPIPVAWIRFLSPLRYEDLQALRQFGWLPNLAPISSAPQETVQYLLTLGGALTTFLLVRSITLSLDRSAWVITWPLLAIGTIEGILGIMQAYMDGGEGLARGTYANRDHYAALLEIVFPFALLYPFAIVRSAKARYTFPAAVALKACVPLVVAGILITAIIHSLSRGGFLSTLGSLLVCGMIAIGLRDGPVKQPRPAFWRLIPAALALLILILAFIYLPPDSLISRFSEFAQTDDISADTRAQIWRDTAAMIKPYMWTGAGWGAYQYTFLRFKTVAPMNTVDYAHNDYLQVLVEAGPLVFTLQLMFLLRMLWLALRRPHDNSTEPLTLSIACAGACASILLHSVVDFSLYVPANLLIFAWVVGITSALANNPVRE